MTRRRPSSSNNNTRATSGLHSICSWPAQTSRKSASERVDGKERGGPGVIQVHISHAYGREGEPRRERFPHPHRLARVIPPTVTYSYSRSEIVSAKVDLRPPWPPPIPHQVGHRFVPLIAATPMFLVKLLPLVSLFISRAWAQLEMAQCVAGFGWVCADLWSSEYGC